MAIVPLDALKSEMVRRSSSTLERSLLNYEDGMSISDNLTIEQNIISLSTKLKKMSQYEIEDWYIQNLGIDFDINFCSLTDKSYSNKVLDFSRFDWFGLDKRRFENLVYALSNADTIINVDKDSIKLLSIKLQEYVRDKREEIYRVIRILVIAFHLELYNTILSLTGFILTQIHVNILFQ